MISWDMVGLDLLDWSLVGLVCGAKHVCMVLGLATGGMPVSVVQFWL
jgi:hypothetical protein